MIHKNIVIFLRLSLSIPVAILRNITARCPRVDHYYLSRYSPGVVGLMWCRPGQPISARMIPALRQKKTQNRRNFVETPTSTSTSSTIQATTTAPRQTDRQTDVCVQVYRLRSIARPQARHVASRRLFRQLAPGMCPTCQRCPSRPRCLFHRPAATRRSLRCLRECFVRQPVRQKQRLQLDLQDS